MLYEKSGGGPTRYMQHGRTNPNYLVVNAANAGHTGRMHVGVKEEEEEEEAS